MSRYSLPVESGTYNITVDDNKNANHVMSMSVDGSGFTGTAVVKARAPGSTTFYDIPDGTFTLPAADTVLFTYVVAEYEVELTVTAPGTATEVILTDVNAEVRYG